jgi:hypothetical protein
MNKETEQFMVLMIHSHTIFPEQILIYSFIRIYCVSALYHVQTNKHRIFTAIFAINTET